MQRAFMGTPLSAASTAPRRGAARRTTFRAARLVIGGALLLTLILGSLLAPFIAPFDPIEQEIGNRLKSPAWRSGPHVLGTDHLGRDLLSRILYGGRVTLVVALTAAGLAATLGVFLGLLSGFFGGHLDATIMSVADIQLALPFVLLSIVIVATLGVGLWKVVVVLILSGWVVFARLTRSVVLSLREMEFVLASKALGATDAGLLLRHILPHTLSPVVAITAAEVARMILAESALSFLGLSGKATVPTWGGILSDSRDYVYQAPWMLIFPGVAIMSTVMSINLVGEWLRQTMNPRSRSS